MGGITGLGMNSALSIQTLVDMRNNLTDLQRQLGTGQKSSTYAGVGLDRGLAIGFRQHLSAVQGFQSSITQVGVRLDLAQTALSQMTSVSQTAKTSVLTSQFALDGNQTSDQRATRLQLEQMLNLLNTSTGGRYLFSGKSIDEPPTADVNQVLDGSGTQAGLKQLITERRAADLGTTGLGRLDVTWSGTQIDLAEDSLSPFGFKLAGVVSSLTNATAAMNPAVPLTPDSLTIDLSGGNPDPGDTIRLTFTLPDGTSQDLTLRATSTSPPGENEFLIDTLDNTVTATNLKNAIIGSLSKLAGTALSAASAVAAGNDFFNVDDANPPQRVDGPPFDTATALRDGTSTDTLTWYTGEGGTDDPRATSKVRADQSLSLSYGARANEQALRRAVQAMAVFAATSYSASDANAAASYASLKSRIASLLDGPPGEQRIEDISGDLASVQNAMKASKARHDQTTNTLQQVLQDVEGAPTEEVAAKILTLQTNLQATLQTTSMLLQTNLLQYL